MKKLLLLTLFFSTVFASNSHAQVASGPAATPPQTREVDHAALLWQTKEEVAPLMVGKTGLSEAQANKVIEILYEMRQAAGALQGLSDAERSAKLAELKATKDKRMSELLTADQISAVKKFYEEMRRNRQQKSGN